MKTRIETDTIGEIEVPAEAYFGAFTQRARRNFQISGIRANRRFIEAIALIKKACAIVNVELGVLDEDKGSAIVSAADDVIAGKYNSQFVLDVFQAGAGTPFNMNVNEVIANAAIEKLGGWLGDYSLVHPNNHVNMSQSSNDVIPTATRICALFLLPDLIVEIRELGRSFEHKASEYGHVVKVGRTHYEDAVPITYGQVFGAYASAMVAAIERIEDSKRALLTLGIGGTAVGTGLNTHPRFRRMVIQELSELTGMRFTAGNPVELTWSMAAFVTLSGALRMLANELRKLSNDMMLLNSGPRAGLSEIVLPDVEPGSSIMPGKVNPSILEALDMVCFQVSGNDHAIAEASAAGVLEINVMCPVISYNLNWSIELLTNAIRMLREECVDGIRVDEERCKSMLENSLSLATVLNPYIGYDAAAELVKTALREGKTLRQVAFEKEVLPPDVLERILNPEYMTAPSKDAVLAKKR